MFLLFFALFFAILALSVWWRFVVMLRSRPDVPNDQVNWWFPLLIKFHLIDEHLECLLFLHLCMYVFYFLPQNGILLIFFLYIMLWFSATKIYSFLPFFGLQDSVSWSGYLEMFIENSFLHGDFQGFPQYFIQLSMLQSFRFPGASILRSISWWPILIKIFAINSLIYLFSQGI